MRDNRGISVHFALESVSTLPWNHCPVWSGIRTLPKAPENMARYQSSLDNELYKAMRALKDAQAWRVERRLNVATDVSDTKSD